MGDFIPKPEAEKVIWYENLSDKAGTKGTALGLNATQVTNLQKTCKDIQDAIKANNEAQTAAKSAKKAKDTAIADGEKELRVLIRIIKSNADFNDAVAQDFMIAGDEEAFNPGTFKPAIKAKIMPGKVVIEFVKHKLNGINIYERLKGETTWTKLAYDSFSPYEDNRPLAVDNTPEHREYMAIGVIHDEEVTLQSDIIEVLYGG